MFLLSERLEGFGVREEEPWGWEGDLA